MECEGRYIYCMCKAEEPVTLGKIGIGNSEVYSICHQGVAAMVHICKAKPYESSDEERVKEWVLSHQYTIDKATEKFGTVIPFTFDTIFKGGDEKVKEWIGQHLYRLRQKLDSLQNLDEYGVQIYWDARASKHGMGTNGEQEGQQEKSRKKGGMGMAYLMKRKAEKEAERSSQEKADELRNDLFTRIKAYTQEAKTSKSTPKFANRERTDKKLLVDLSCLVSRDSLSGLSKELEEIDGRSDFEVRFTGPWPPYSFVQGF